MNSCAAMQLLLHTRTGAAHTFSGMFDEVWGASGSFVGTCQCVDSMAEDVYGRNGQSTVCVLLQPLLHSRMRTGQPAHLEYCFWMREDTFVGTSQTTTGRSNLVTVWEAL